MKPIDDPRIEARIALAEEVIRPLRTRTDVRGVFLYGSSVRPYGDERSDFDVGVLVAPETLAAMRLEDIHAGEVAAGQTHTDLWYVVVDELRRPQVDAERRRAACARVLYDPTGELTAALTVASELPDQVRQERMRVHYAELTYAAHKLQRAQLRAKASVVRMLAAAFVTTAAKLLFFVQGEWPAPFSWMFDELPLAGVPPELSEELSGVLEAPTGRAVRAIRARIDAYLLECGLGFIDDPRALWAWLLHTPDGRHAQSSAASDVVRLG